MKRAVLLLLIILTGCAEDTQRAQQLVLRKHSGPPGAANSASGTASERDAVLLMVQQTPVDENDDAETFGEWIDGTLNGEDGQVMFPKWDVKRRGQRKYEVLFTYTVLGDDYAITRKGYSWNVDYVLQLVGQVNRISEEDLDRHSGYKSALQRRADTKERVINLE